MTKIDLQFCFSLVMNKDFSFFQDPKIGDGVSVSFDQFGVVRILVLVCVHIGGHEGECIGENHLLAMVLYTAIKHSAGRFHFDRPGNESHCISVRGIS